MLWTFLGIILCVSCSLQATDFCHSIGSIRAWVFAQATRLLRIGSEIIELRHDDCTRKERGDGRGFFALSARVQAKCCRTKCKLCRVTPHALSKGKGLQAPSLSRGQNKSNKILQDISKHCQPLWVYLGSWRLRGLSRTLMGPATHTAQG